MILEKALRPKHPDVAWSLYGLAQSERALGQYNKAQLLLRRALEIREKALGSQHPDMAWDLDALVALYNHERRVCRG